jgi:hypothetical protein
MEQWIKSSYSRGKGGNCLEIRWTKSSYSTGHNPNCVECRAEESRVHVRDTQHREHGILAFPATEWRAFLAELERL